MFTSVRKITQVTSIGILLMLSGQALAQNLYPSKPITVVVPTGAGGSTDIVARIVSDKLGQIIGQPVVVTNKAGAAGVIGTQFVTNSEPNGYTLLISTNQIAMAPHFFEKPPYDATKQLSPVTGLAMVPIVLVMNPKIPVNNVPKLIEYARSNPEKLSYGSAGNGSPNHLLFELFKSKAGINVMHVPYKGIAPAVHDVVSGNLSLAVASLPSVQGLVESGRLKLLAVTSDKRLPSLPDIPTIAEAVPGYEGSVWVGMWAATNTPPEIIAKLHSATLQALADPQVKARLAEGGMLVETSSPRDLGARLATETNRWSEIVRNLDGPDKKK